MKVVITGGAGFIGSHIAKYWADNNAEVFVIDNLRSGFRKNISGYPGITFVKESITSNKKIEQILEGSDYVHHLAAMISVPESVDKPDECVKINVNGYLNILNSAVKHGVKKVILSSSAAIYGDNPELPKKTSMIPEPKSPYGITKLDGEYYNQFYFNQYGLKTVALRYFNVFGPRQDPKSQYAAAVPIFILKALKNMPIVIYGDGEQTRDFIYIDDVVDVNILAAKKENITGVFNVAKGETITINQLAKLIIEETNSNSEIIHNPVRQGDIKFSLASIDETREKLEFNPSISLIDGIRRTIEYFAQITA